MRSLSPLPSGYVKPRHGAVATAGRLATPRLVGARGQDLIDRVAGLIRSLRDDLVRRRERAAMIHQLSSLSDHTLKDIGLNRGGIRTAVMDLERGIDPRHR